MLLFLFPFVSFSSLFLKYNTYYITSNTSSGVCLAATPAILSFTDFFFSFFVRNAEKLIKKNSSLYCT